MSGTTGPPAGVAVLILAVLLAGCAALGGGGGPTETVTPVEVTTERAYPPGVDGSGVLAPGVLAEAHADGLEGSSYTLVSNRTVRYANGTVRSGLHLRVRLAANRSYHATVRTAGPAGPVVLGEPPAAAEFWSDGERYLRAYGRTNRTYNEFTPGDYAGTWRYWVGEAAFGGQAGSPGRTIRTVFGAVPTRVDGWRENPARVRVVGTGHRSAAFAGEIREVRNVTLSAEIDSTGVLRRLTLRYRGTVDGQSVSVRRTVRYGAVGTTTVGRPAWADRVQ